MVMDVDVLGFHLPNWILWLTGVAVPLYLYGTWPHASAKEIRLPGPPMRPFVGSMLDMITFPKHIGEYLLHIKKKYGPLIRLLHMRLPVIAIFDLDIIKAVAVKEHSNFTDRRKFPNSGLMKYSLLSRTGTAWKENRSLITPFFSTGKLKHNFELIKSCCEKMTKQMKKASEEGRTVEAKKYTGNFTMDVICSTGFGLDVDSASDPNHPFIAHAKGVAEIDLTSPSSVITMIFPFLEHFFNLCNIHILPSKIGKFFKNVTLEAMRLRLESKQKRPDFIDAMIRAHEEEVDAESINDMEGVSPEELRRIKRKGLTHEEITANGILLFLAGYDTTATTLAFVIYSLACHQDWQEKCVQEIREIIGEHGDLDYDSISKLKNIDMCIEETQRLFPISFFVDRVASRDMTIKDLNIPKGTSCLIPIWAIHHDPDIWPDPEKFDPLRFSADAKLSRNSYSYMPFGVGPRSCVGRRLALLEIKIGLVQTLQNFRINVEENAPFPPEMSNTIHLSAKHGLWVKFVPR